MPMAVAKDRVVPHAGEDALGADTHLAVSDVAPSTIYSTFDHPSMPARVRIAGRALSVR